MFFLCTTISLRHQQNMVRLHRQHPKLCPARTDQCLLRRQLGEEGLVSTYTHSHGLNTFIFRFADIVGPRLRGAGIPDFIGKLHASLNSLTILGNGCQEKSYMHVIDCVDAMGHIIEHASEQARPVHTYNLGTKTTTAVDEIAEIVCDVVGVGPT